MKNKSFLIIMVATILLPGVSCTKLDEEGLVYDKVLADQFGKTDLELISLVGAAYSNLGAMGGDANFFPLTEASSDEIIVPTRGVDWYDGGKWQRLKTHTYKADDPHPGGAWSLCYGGIATCNRLIANLTALNTPASLSYIAELKVLRAVYYFWLLDWFGNVPVSTDFADVTPPSTKPRAEVYAFVEKELLENGNLLPKTGPSDPSTYGRVNYYTAKACLAKLYLNAQVYTGTAQWDKAIAACDTIILSSKYALTADYYDNFKRDNKYASEAIWAVPFDEKNFAGFNLDMMTLHLSMVPVYNMAAQPWNGFSASTEIYKSYIDPAQNPGPEGQVVSDTDPLGGLITGTVDKRYRNFIVGPQFSATGARITDGGADPADPDGGPVTLTPYINELEPQAWRQAGARIGKWTFYSGMGQNLDNDFIIFRYADILLTKAEATARNTGDWNNATTKDIINTIRLQHGGVDPFATVTQDLLLGERGREMFFEGWRRQDQIRFGTYNKAYQFHPADADSHINIFPIPQTQIDANKNLTQNAGY